ncbi:MAG: universal stress protein [Eggerthellaceae bacterium]|nr:universal stress protein [Eggerthellaceae bacterium]
MLYKRILVPFDGSDPAKNALEVAKRLIADDPEAVLSVLSVVPAGAVAAELEAPSGPGGATPLLFPDMQSYERVIERAKERAMDDLNDALGDALDDVACDVQVGAVISSKVADGICDYAEANGCEIIVMGRRGLGALRGMLGSVSYAVLHEADVPVLTVR